MSAQLVCGKFVVAQRYPKLLCAALHRFALHCWSTVMTAQENGEPSMYTQTSRPDSQSFSGPHGNVFFAVPEVPEEDVEDVDEVEEVEDDDDAPLVPLLDVLPEDEVLLRPELPLV
ncbi:hypothetical protein BH11MYX4_BH11MYX4_12760 [soil metagenome]